ncbi:RNA 3'-terminal phosphate cyclase isoform X2 [Rhinolophus ferrumequinum]|uniref:RNA 3'-terminal phosphate cyclase isoform X2 n=1 Tax=Rhinolophus ferrumequinum TaxID=59479 RepID=UPI00140F8B8E|nr:RNA 3'-terminal phosphate cyclase isoform X2 [Rhinolophus ferrumequinum]
MAGQPVEVDGGIMEGGGQILRVSTALSCLLGLPLRVQNIRAGRSTPGLRSVCLLMQVSMPCVLFAASPSELRLKGGTNAEMAPQIDYTVMVFKPIVEKFGFKFNCDIKIRGYYPKGGGEVIVQISPVKQLNPINLTDCGSVTKIHGRAFVAGVLPFKVAKEMAAAAVRCIRKEYRDLYVNIQPVQEAKDQAFGNGSGIIIIAETSTGCLLAGSSLGKRGVNADKVGIEAAEMLLANLRHGGAVDEYLQDQLIIFMALASGVSRIKTGPITLHTQTAIHFAEQLAKAKFTVKKSENEDDASKDTYIIECQGIGMTNPNL